MVAHPHWASGAERFRTLYQLLAALSRANTLADVYDVALTSLLAATVADRAALLLFDDDGILRYKASKGLSAECQAAVAGRSPWARGTRDARPVAVPDVTLDDNLASYREMLLREGIGAIAFVPLSSGRRCVRPVRAVLPRGACVYGGRVGDREHHRRARGPGLRKKAA